MNCIEDKCIGSMIAGAAGDALGYVVEFVPSFGAIAAKYGAGGIRDFRLTPNQGEVTGEQTVALVSDDTQMSLYTAEGLLYAMEHGAPIIDVIREAYLHWFGGQNGLDIKGCYPSELALLDDLNQCRAPGNTCLSALMSIYSGNKPNNNSKGCGGIMRIAPIAIYGAVHGWSLEQTAKLAGEVAEITHMHGLSTLSSACCAAIIQECILEPGSIDAERFCDIVESAVRCIEGLYPESAYLVEFRNIVENALKWRDSDLDDWQIIERHMGEGWVAEETLAIALFSVAREIDSVDRCLVCAVNHGGDSDSTGAVAGNIIGAILGYEAIPEKYIKHLQFSDLIASMGRRLCN